MKEKNPTSTASNSHPAIAGEMVETAAEADAPVEAVVDAIAVVAADMAVVMVATAAVVEGASPILVRPRFKVAR